MSYFSIVSSDGKFMACICRNDIQLFSLPNPKQISDAGFIPIGKGNIADIQWSPSGTLVLIIYDSGKTHLFQSQVGEKEWKLKYELTKPGAGMSITSVSWSNVACNLNAFLGLGTSDGNSIFYLFNQQGNIIYRNTKTHSDSVNELKWNKWDDKGITVAILVRDKLEFLRFEGQSMLA